LNIDSLSSIKHIPTNHNRIYSLFLQFRNKLTFEKSELWFLEGLVALFNSESEDLLLLLFSYKQI
jgi:hypothetical protein